MDRLSKLEALIGGGAVIEKDASTEAENPWAYRPKANNVYEGTDSEDEEIGKMMSNTGTLDQKTGQIIYKDGNCVDTTNIFGFTLRQGELAPEGVRFMPFKMVTKYPYQFIGHRNRQRVAEAFFDKGQIYGHTYDLFYLYADQTGLNQQPVVLIPTKQFERLLEAINAKLKTRLSIPQGDAGDAFYFGFMNDGNPYPRYLGRSTSREQFDDLKFQTPPYYYKLNKEPSVKGTPSDRSLAAFQAKFAQITANEKGKKAAQKGKQAKDRIQRQQGWGASIKRVQYYLGIREMRDDSQAIQANLQNSGLDWVDIKAAAKAAAAKLPPPTFFDPEKSMKFKPLDSVVFISVDVEAYEMNHKQITEIGIATLDTLDLLHVKPGSGGREWMQQIRARHFRIHENRFLINRVHVTGCPDRFEFGESEFISMNDAPSAIASCFKHPFSGEEKESADWDSPKRNIVLVGHNVDADINFLKSIGYNITNLSNLKEIVDTADMWKYLKQETNPTKLGAVLHELGLVGWNLHNAGNDAVYTLQIMIGTAIKHITNKTKGQEVIIKESRGSMAKNIAEAAAEALSHSNGWDTDDEDGGVSLVQVRKNSDKGSKDPVLQRDHGFPLTHRPKLVGIGQSVETTTGKSISSTSEALIDFNELSISKHIDRDGVKHHFEQTRNDTTGELYEGDMNKPLCQFLNPESSVNYLGNSKAVEGTTKAAASAPARQVRYTKEDVANAIMNAPCDESTLVAMTVEELMHMPHVTQGRARNTPSNEWH